MAVSLESSRAGVRDFWTSLFMKRAKAIDKLGVSAMPQRKEIIRNLWLEAWVITLARPMSWFLPIQI